MPATDASLLSYILKYLISKDLQRSNLPPAEGLPAEREIFSLVTKTVRCAYLNGCAKVCQHSIIACQRPVVTYADPLKFTLQWFKDMLGDNAIASEAAADQEFNISLARGYLALAAGELESAELAIEHAVELFAGIQNRAFVKRRSRKFDGDASIGAGED